MKLMSMQTMSVAAVRVVRMIVPTRVVRAIVLAMDRGVIMVAMAARLGNWCN